MITSGERDRPNGTGGPLLDAAYQEARIRREFYDKAAPQGADWRCILLEQATHVVTSENPAEIAERLGVLTDTANRWICALALRAANAHQEET